MLITPDFDHRLKRLYTVFHDPYSSGKSRYGASEHNTRNMPLMILRCSVHGRPERGVAGSADSKGWMNIHASSGRSQQARVQYVVETDSYYSSGN